MLAIAGLTTIAAGFVRGLAGFGFAVVLVPVLSLTLLPVEALMVTNVVAVLLGLSELRFLLREQERSSLTIAAFAALATAPGLWLLLATPPDLARLLIVLVGVAAFAAVLLPASKGSVPRMPTTIATGIGAGLLTGFAGMPAPPVVPYYVRRRVQRTVAKASMLFIFTVAAAAGLGAGAYSGVLEWRLVVFGAVLFPLTMIGNWLGFQASGKIGDVWWRGFVALVLGLAALASVVKLLA